MQIAPRNARPRNPENPIQNKTMVPRATSTARAALNHEWFKAGPFLVAHQTPEHDSFPKSYRESETTPVGNPLCQHILSCRLLRGEHLGFLCRKSTGSLKCSPSAPGMARTGGKQSLTSDSRPERVDGRCIEPGLQKITGLSPIVPKNVRRDDLHVPGEPISYLGASAWNAPDRPPIAPQINGLVHDDETGRRIEAHHGKCSQNTEDAPKPLIWAKHNIRHAECGNRSAENGENNP